MTRKLATFAVDAGRPLAAWLAERLSLPEASMRTAIALGSVWVDGVRVRADQAVRAGQKIVVHETPERHGSWKIVHHDDDVLVVDKTAELASQAERHGGDALDEQVAEKFAGARLLHRIDRDTSGLVLFTLRPERRAELQSALERGAIEREYLAIVAGHPAADAFVLDAPIGTHPDDPRRFSAAPGAIAAKPARTEVTVEQRGESGVALLRVRLITGRTHQIRVHLLAAGHPVLGDPIYAPPAVRARAPRLALHATRLAWPGGEAGRGPPDEARSPLIETATSPLPPELAALVC